VIDVNVGFTDPASPLVCELEDVVAAIRRLLDEFRRAELPVVYTTVSYGEGDKVTAAAFIDKIPALLTLEAGSRWVEIDPRIAPLPTEPVLNKLFASAFFGTPLASLLASAGCDSVVITGASTSGCVRATAVDALQHGYRPAVPREAVGCARGEPVRHRHEVRRRRRRRRRGRAPGGACRCRTRWLRRSCSPTATRTRSGRATW
jgi:maleamate amidohydrolase